MGDTTTETVLSADGTKIVCHRGGTGPVLLMVHGALATVEMYEPIAALLREHYHVVLIERRGYGVSGDGARPGTFALHSADIEAVLAHVGGTAFVFGHSAGGMATLHALPGANGRIRAAALYEATTTLGGETLRPVLARCRELVDAGRPADAVVEFLTTSGEEPDESVPVAMIGELLAHRAPGLIEDLECVTAMSPDPAIWAGVDLPVQLLVGSESEQVAKTCTDAQAAVLPDCETVVLRGQGHHPDDAALVADALHAYFSRH